MRSRKRYTLKSRRRRRPRRRPRPRPRRRPRPRPRRRLKTKKHRRRTRRRKVGGMFSGWSKPTSKPKPEPIEMQGVGAFDSAGEELAQARENETPAETQAREAAEAEAKCRAELEELVNSPDQEYTRLGGPPNKTAHEKVKFVMHNKYRELYKRYKATSRDAPERDLQRIPICLKIAHRAYTEAHDRVASEKIRIKSRQKPFLKRLLQPPDLYDFSQ